MTTRPPMKLVKRQTTVFPRSLLLAPFALLVSACATPPVRTANTALPATYDVNGTLPAVSLDDWWRLYGDAQLAMLVDQALNHGFSVREAFARLDEARATRSAALSQYGLKGAFQTQIQQQRSGIIDMSIPGLSGTEFGDALAPSATTSRTASLPISWELDLFGRRSAARRTANADLAAARFTYEGARATLAADVARQFFQARGLCAQLNDARATLTLQIRLLGILHQKASRGLGPTSEEDRVAGDVAQSEAQVADLSAALDAARRALLVLIGSGTAPLDTLPVTADLVDLPTIPTTIPGELLVRRPDVREARARLDAASGNVRLAKLAFYPTISLQAALAYSSQTGGLATTSVNKTGTAGLTLPIFDRARLHAELRGASARAEQSVLAYERILQTAYSETDQALIRLDADRTRISTLGKGEVRAQRAYDAALKRYQLGLSDLQDVLDAERAFRSARTALTTARVDGLSRTVQAFQALGGGWTPPAAPITPGA